MKKTQNPSKITKNLQNLRTFQKSKCIALIIFGRKSLDGADFVHMDSENIGDFLQILGWYMPISPFYCQLSCKTYQGTCFHQYFSEKYHTLKNKQFMK
jgi:hypothetical protein